MNATHRFAPFLLASLASLILPAPAHSEWLTDGTIVCIVPGNQHSPRTCTDGSGGMIVIGIDLTTPSPQLFAQRMLADGTRAWGASGILVGPGNLLVGPAAMFSVAPLAAGGCRVLWHTNTGVRGLELDAAGNVAPGWPAGGRVIATKAPWETWLRVAPAGATAIDFIADQYDTVDVSIRRLVWTRLGLDGSPQAGWPKVLASATQGWSDFRFDSMSSSADGTVWLGKMYMMDGGPGPNTYSGSLSSYSPEGVFLTQRTLVSASYPPIVTIGGPANEVFTLSPTLARWTADGTAVWPSTPSIPFTPELVLHDGAGGLWFADDTHIDHVMPDGSIPPAFGTTGLVLPGAPTNQPISASVEGTGLWLARTRDSDLYVHNILGDGTLPPKWLPEGARASGAGESQGGPSAPVPNGDGHALVAWSDGRLFGGATRVYANRVGPNPLLGVGPPSAPTGLRASLRARLTGRSGLEVSFTTAVDGDVALELLDVTGRRVAGARVTAEAGQLTAHAFDAGRLASGLYFVHARQGATSAAVRAFVLR